MPSSPKGTPKSARFPFLRLPAELRLKIYSYVCDRRFMSVPPRGRTTTFANAFHLARLCRQIRSEALPHVFARTVLIIEWNLLNRDVYVNLPSAAARAVTAVRIVSFPMDHKDHLSTGDVHPWSLMDFFPSLRHLRVVLKSGECISSLVASDPWDWGHEGFTADDVMRLSGVDWICRNQGLKKFTFKVYTLCPECARVGNAHTVLKDVGRMLKEDLEQL